VQKYENKLANEQMRKTKDKGRMTKDEGELAN